MTALVCGGSYVGLASDASASDRASMEAVTQAANLVPGCSNLSSPALHTRAMRGREILRLLVDIPPSEAEV